MCDAEKLMLIKFDEFLEYICRVADFAQFGDQHQPGWTQEESESEKADGSEKSDKEEEVEIPADIKLLGKMVEDISFNNANNYFRFGK